MARTQCVSCNVIDSEVGNRMTQKLPTLPTLKQMCIASICPQHTSEKLLRVILSGSCMSTMGRYRQLPQELKEECLAYLDNMQDAPPTTKAHTCSVTIECVYRKRKQLSDGTIIYDQTHKRRLIIKSTQRDRDMLGKFVRVRQRTDDDCTIHNLRPMPANGLELSLHSK